MTNKEGAEFASDNEVVREDLAESMTEAAVQDEEEEPTYNDYITVLRERRIRHVHQNVVRHALGLNPEERGRIAMEMLVQPALHPDMFRRATLLLVSAALAGAVFAQTNLGIMLAYGVDAVVLPNRPMARQWLELARASGSGIASKVLGDLHADPSSADLDYSKALAYWGESAQRGCHAQELVVASMYYKGEGCAVNYEKSYHWYEAAARRGETDAIIMCAHHCLRGLHEPMSHAKAFEWVRMGEAAGEVHCTRAMGIMLLNGHGCEIDEERGFAMLAKAFHINASVACETLFGAIKAQRGVLLQSETAVSLLGEIVHFGHVHAQELLCNVYLSGYNGAIGDDLAAEMTHRCMNIVLPHASFLLGQCYMQGKGVECNYQQAIALFRRAAEEQHALAMVALGSMYLKLHIDEDGPQRAFELFNRARDLGVYQASYHLGVMYYRGLWVAQSSETALTLFEAAAKRGHVQAAAYAGMMLIYKVEGESNISRGIVYLERALACGQLLISRHLARAYVVTGKLSTAERLFTQCIDRDDTDAMVDFSRLCMSARYGSRNVSKAIALLQRAHAHGSVRATKMLAGMYATGDCVAKNLQRAAELYEITANHNDAESSFWLASYYSSGALTQTANLRTKAFRLAHRAAVRMYPKAANLLAHFFMTGYGCKIDNRRAAFWNGLALSAASYATPFEDRQAASAGRKRAHESPADAYVDEVDQAYGDAHDL